MHKPLGGRNRRELKLAAALLSVITALLTAEVAFRLWGPFGLEYMEMDTVLGWRYRSGAHYKFQGIPEAVCGWGSTGRINAHGLRDREYAYEKEPGTFRVLALGDSFTAAIEHPVDQTWTKFLERRLNARSGDLTFEVINAGRSASGTGYQYLWYDTEGYKYSPDLVLLVVIGNDLTDNFRALAEREGRHWLWDPFFELRDGELVRDDSFTRTPDFERRRWTMPLRRHSELIRTILGMRTLNLGYSVATEQPREAPSAEISSAIEVTKALLKALASRTVKDGAPLVVFNGLPDYTWGLKNQPDRLLREVATEDPRLTYRDLVGPLGRFTAATQRRAYGCEALDDIHAGHWSREGHAEVARLIEETLLEAGLIGQSSSRPFWPTTTTRPELPEARTSGH